MVSMARIELAMDLKYNSSLCIRFTVSGNTIEAVKAMTDSGTLSC